MYRLFHLKTHMFGLLLENVEKILKTDYVTVFYGKKFIEMLLNFDELKDNADNVVFFENWRSYKNFVYAILNFMKKKHTFAKSSTYEHLGYILKYHHFNLWTQIPY